MSVAADACAFPLIKCIPAHHHFIGQYIVHTLWQTEIDTLNSIAELHLHCICTLPCVHQDC